MGELRPIKITNNYLKNTAGSVLVEFGNTKVICAASLDDKTAPFLKNTGKGWLTAEYSMLPMSTQTRTARESVAGKSGRADARNSETDWQIAAGSDGFNCFW